MLGDALRSLILGQSQKKWDAVLPQFMRIYRSTPHFSTQEIPNLLMLSCETQVLEHLTYHVPASESPVHEYLEKLIETMEGAHNIIQEKQWQVRM